MRCPLDAGEVTPHGTILATKCCYLVLKAPYFNLIIAGFVVYGITAWYSAGYHHPDEHFQILELANYKLGKTPAADLPWEFEARIRPGLQPGIAYVVVGVLRAMGVENPFHQAFALRLLSGWLMWGVFWAWASQLGRSMADNRLTAALLWSGLLLWFMPYLSVRFSSENWAALTFLAGLLFIMQFIENKENRVGWRLLTGGLLLGLSFFFRFQMAFALTGVAAWLLYHRHVRPADWAWLLLGGGVAVGLGVCADYWLYGHWEFTALQYFQANILENKAANWGTAPWWFYLREVVLSGLPPVSLLLVGLAVWGGWRHRQHVLVWVILPFVLAHLLVGHKELRFLFPMVLPWLVLAVLAWQPARLRFGPRRWARVLYGLAVGINLLALPLRCLTPANEALPYFRYVYDRARQGPVTLLAVEKDPYNLVGLTAHFYQPDNLTVQVLPTLEQLDSLDVPTGSLFLYSKLNLPATTTQPRMQRCYTYFPDWILAFNINDWQSRSRIWSIYQVQ